MNDCIGIQCGKSDVQGKFGKIYLISINIIVF